MSKNADACVSQKVYCGALMAYCSPTAYYLKLVGVGIKTAILQFISADFTNNCLAGLPEWLFINASFDLGEQNVICTPLTSFKPFFVIIWDYSTVARPS